MIDRRNVRRLMQEVEKFLEGQELAVVLPVLSSMLLNAAICKLYGDLQEASDEEVRAAAKALAERFSGLAKDVTPPASLH
jgi:hypothetical protein